MDGDAEAWDGLLRALGDRPRKALDRALQQLRVVKQHARRLAADVHLCRPQQRPSHRPQTGGISTHERARARVASAAAPPFSRLHLLTVLRMARPPPRNQLMSPPTMGTRWWSGAHGSCGM